MDIQWYPGHMAKAKRMMQENLTLVDIVIELLDARIPYSSRNPDLDALAKNKHRIVLLNKSDLADQAVTEQWIRYYRDKGFEALVTDSAAGKGLNAVVDASRRLMQEKIERLKARGRLFVPIRAMIVGIPNVGKSTLINKITGKAPTAVGDKPGVTRGKQWVKIKKDFELLDTPGILWPKTDDDTIGLHLAFTGAIKDTITEPYTLAVTLVETLLEICPEGLYTRYAVKRNEGEPPEELLAGIGEARGFKGKGGQIDLERTAVILLDEFRAGKLGKISLESPESVK